MKPSLRTLLLGLTSVAIVVVTVGGLVVNLRERVSGVSLRLAAQTERRTATGGPLLLDSLIVGDLAAVEQTLKRLNADHVWRQVKLYESDGQRLMIDASPTASTASAAPRWFRRLLPVQLPEHRHQIAADPVVYAVLAVTPASEALESELWAETRGMGATTLVLLLTLLGLMHVILIYGLRPIRALGHSARRFGSGDLTARMPETSLSEVAPTVQAFNAMADSVEGLLAEVRAKEAANRRLAAVVEQSGEAILTIDLGHRITSWNVGAERRFGRTAPEAMGQSIGLVLVPEPGGTVIDRIARLIETRPPSRLETTAVEPSGRELVIAAASSPLHDDVGAHAG